MGHDAQSPRPAPCSPRPLRLSHKALGGGGYKWLLYGDDDTYFFLDSVRELLRDYDPDLPYVVTGAGGIPIIMGAGVGSRAWRVERKTAGLKCRRPGGQRVLYWRAREGCMPEPNE